MSNFSLNELYNLTVADYNTYLISKQRGDIDLEKTFLRTSKTWYNEYKEKGGKKKFKPLE